MIRRRIAKRHERANLIKVPNKFMSSGCTKRWLLLIFTLPFFDVASAQIVQPIPKNLIQAPTKKIQVFSLGYGAGVANYMCFEALKSKLSLAQGNEILESYRRWINQQQTVNFNHFSQGYNFEVQQFNQAFPNNLCPFRF